MKRLFNKLMKLCANEDNLFFFKDDVSAMGTSVRIFSYHIANYSEWIKPGALECRGIMFEMKDSAPVRIMARPMEKFFNLNENPLSMNLDMSTAMFYTTKEDGSLISSFVDQGVLGVKSKTSLYSVQAQKAGAWLSAQVELRDRVLQLAKDGYTVNFEYVGPDNRIVLPYEVAHMRILNIRHTKTGEYVGLDEIHADAVLRPYMVEVFDSSVCSDDWVEKVRKMEGIEGYIIAFPDKMVKLKTAWYVALHHTKDSINSNSRLAECCVNSASDDLRGLFADDTMALEKIAAFEAEYMNNLSHWFSAIVDFIEGHRHLDRREYAIAATTIFKGEHHLFHVAMRCYIGWSQEMIIDGLHTAMKKNIDLIIPKQYA